MYDEFCPRIYNKNVYCLYYCLIHMNYCIHLQFPPLIQQPPRAEKKCISFLTRFIIQEYLCHQKKYYDKGCLVTR